MRTGVKATGELEQMDTPSGQCLLAPYIAGLGCSVLDGANPTEVLKQLKIAIVNGSSRQIVEADVGVPYPRDAPALVPQC